MANSTLIALALAASVFHPNTPLISYTLAVREDALSFIDVEMRLRNVPDTFRVAMVKHPEYDDQYWRYVEGLTLIGTGSIVRLDSALWRVATRGGEATLRYRIHLPEATSPTRAAWRPFLSPTGGLIGGPHSFMYIVGATDAPSTVALKLPAGWEIATALTNSPVGLKARNVDALVESPILVGRFKSWRFVTDGVPHRVVYWPLPNAAPFDTTAFVSSLQKLAHQAIGVFKRAPYAEYTFFFQDGAYGGLEHPASVTLGAPSANLATNPYASLSETAHEFFHTWNLMAIRPAEYRGVDYRPQELSAGLWFSEGLSMLYSDLLLRRAGLPVSDSTRTAHLERQMARYLQGAGNGRLSPERVSRAAYAEEPGSLGDYDASTHLQGELLGTMLDFIVRDATAGRRSIDDVMRVMFERFSGPRGFVGRDIEQVVTEVCSCNVHDFFEAHVRGSTAIDFKRYLALAGLEPRVEWVPALGRDGAPAPDLRVRAWEPRNERGVRLVVIDAEAAWGRAGLHTGDRLRSVNGVPITTWNDFRAMLGRLRSGDTVRVEVERPSGPWQTTVTLAPFNRPVVRIEPLANATERQRAIRSAWLGGA
jgi:predicted metalloprotease with PDZ domain